MVADESAFPKKPESLEWPSDRWHLVLNNG